MDDEEYVSLENLKKPSSRQDLQASIDGLNQSINSLIGLFKEAAESLKIEEKEASLVASKIDPLFEKLDMIIEQNKKIARGIVAVADMIDERLPKLKGPEKPMPMPERPMFPPLSSPPPFSAPPPSPMGPPLHPMSMPAPPGMRPMPLPPRPLPR